MYVADNSLMCHFSIRHDRPLQGVYFRNKQCAAILGEQVVSRLCIGMLNERFCCQPRWRTRDFWEMCPISPVASIKQRSWGSATQRKINISSSVRWKIETQISTFDLGNSNFWGEILPRNHRSCGIIYSLQPGRRIILWALCAMYCQVRHRSAQGFESRDIGMLPSSTLWNTLPTHR